MNEENTPPPKIFTWGLSFEDPESQIETWLNSKYEKFKEKNKKNQNNNSDPLQLNQNQIYINEVIKKAILNEKNQEDSLHNLKYFGIGVIIVSLAILIPIIPIPTLEILRSAFVISLLVTIFLAVAIFIFLRTSAFRQTFNEWNLKNVKGIDLMTLQGSTIIGVLFFLSISISDNFHIGKIPFLPVLDSENEVKAVVTSLTGSIVLTLIFAASITGLLGDIENSAFYKKIGEPTSNTHWAYKIGLIFTILAFVYLACTMFIVALASMFPSNVDESKNLEKIIDVIQDGKYNISIQATKDSS